MANSPIIIKEDEHQLLTTRQEFINDKNRKYGGSGKFTFRKYKTDKERLEEYLRDKESIDKLIVKPKIENPNNIPPKHHHYYSVQQPTMRFKPRTDLERIYCSVNEQTYGKISKDVVNEQLNKLQLNEVKKTVDDENDENDMLAKYGNMDENTVEMLQIQKEYLNKQGYDEKNSETVKNIALILENYQKNKIKSDEDPSRFKSKKDWRSHVNTKIVKKFLGEYNQKTHFKAATIYSFKLDNHKTNKSKKFEYMKTEANNLNYDAIDQQTSQETEQNTQNDFYETTNHFTNINNLMKKSFKKDILDDISPKDFNVDFNPLFKKEKEIFDPIKLMYLKNLYEGNSTIIENKENSKLNQKNSGFLSSIKNKSMNILAMKNELNVNASLNQLNVNEVEDLKKCKNKI